MPRFEWKAHPTDPFSEFSRPFLAMHRQGAHSVNPRNVVVIPNQLVCKLRQCTETICFILFNLTTIELLVSWEPLVHGLVSAPTAFPRDTMLICVTLDRLAPSLTFPTISRVIQVPVSGVFHTPVIICFGLF